MEISKDWKKINKVEININKFKQQKRFHCTHSLHASTFFKSFYLYEEYVYLCTHFVN